MKLDTEMEIAEAFQLAQKGHSNRAKLVACLKNRYNKLEDHTVFHEEFVHYLKYAMVVYKREPAVEHIIEFASKFATSFESPPKEVEEEEEEEEDEDHPFLNYVFNFLLEAHAASSHAVRFRACQLVNRLLSALGEDGQIDEDLYQRLHKAMLLRVTDKYPNVRIQAVLAMARLQEPRNPHCPTITAYLLLLDNDSNQEVRRAVLSCIALSSLTLPKIFKHTRDVKERVRIQAYQVLADKVHMRALTIAQRVSLLQQGLHDTSEVVREAVCGRVLPAWLRLLKGDVLELLRGLDVESCERTALDTLAALFTPMTPAQLLEDRLGLDTRKLIPVEALSCESVLYWRALCEFLKARGDEGEDLLEQILPSAAEYADYLYEYLSSVRVLSEEQRADFSQLETVMTKEFISQQLIHLTGCLDTNEEGGRKCVVAVLQKMLGLAQTPISLVSLLTEKLLSLIPDDHRRIQMVAEIISEVREPMVVESQPLDETQHRAQQVQLAEVRVRLLEAKQGLEDCVAQQDFSGAARMKELIVQLEAERQALVQEPAPCRQPDPDTHTEKDDPETLLRCLTMCAELLKQLNIKTRMGPTLSATISSLILPSIVNAELAVRNMAVVCLATCALHSKELAETHIVLLLQIAQLDEVQIRISALRAIIDLLLFHGFPLLSGPAPSLATPPLTSDSLGEEAGPQEEEEAGSKEEKEEEAEPKEDNSTTQSFLMMLSDCLDSQVSELRTEAAEGLAKLMFNKRISSAKLLSRLVLLWYNPVTEDDTRLRHCLGVFFQLYARESRTNQECVEECFLPTMKTLMRAPATSPLAEVDILNVAELLTELTCSSTLTKPSTTEEVSVHASLAVRLCVEVLKDPTAPEVRLYARTLGRLDLRATHTSHTHLVDLLQEIVQVVKDKVCLRALEKVLGQLTDSSKRNAAELNGSALPPLNTDEAEGQREDEDSCKSVKKPKRASRKAATGRSTKKASRAEESSSEESDEENVPDSSPGPVPAARPSRQAKTFAQEKVRLDLTALMSQEANTSL